MARPSKLTPARQRAICEGITSGLPKERAAQQAGVARSTFYDWQERGQTAQTGKYRAFVDAVKKATADSEITLLNDVRRAASRGEVIREIKSQYDTDNNKISETIFEKQIPRQWQASAWLLERRFPERWGRYRTTTPPQNDSWDSGPLPWSENGMFDPIDPLAETEDETT